MRAAVGTNWASGATREDVTAHISVPSSDTLCNYGPAVSQHAQIRQNHQNSPPAPHGGSGASSPVLGLRRRRLSPTKIYRPSAVRGSCQKGAHQSPLPSTLETPSWTSAPTSSADFVVQHPRRPPQTLLESPKTRPGSLQACDRLWKRPCDLQHKKALLTCEVGSSSACERCIASSHPSAKIGLPRELPPHRRASRRGTERCHSDSEVDCFKSCMTAVCCESFLALPQMPGDASLSGPTLFRRSARRHFPHHGEKSQMSCRHNYPSMGFPPL